MERKIEMIKILKEHFEILPYNDAYRNQILEVWENAVLATHDFLSRSDFEEIKVLVESIDFNDFQVFCLTNEDRVLGFVGVADRKIEMLFLDPMYFGQGLGKKLLSFAVTTLNAETLDVNEQNLKAVGFYQKSGFETFERRDQDDQARNYPLLRMKLAKPQ